MTVTRGVNETVGSTTGGATQLTGSFTPNPWQLQLLAVMNTHPTAAPSMTVTGCGLTWTQVTGTLFASNLAVISIFRAMGGAPTTGQLTITGNSGVTGYAWEWAFFGRVDLGTGTVPGIVQAATNTAAASSSALVVTLGAFANDENALYGAFAKDTSGAATWTVGAGMLNKNEAGYTVPAARLGTEWNNVPDTTVDMTPTTVSNMGAVAVEIASWQTPAPVMAPYRS